MGCLLYFAGNWTVGSVERTLGMLARQLLVEHHLPGAPGRALAAIAKLPNVYPQFFKSAAEGVAMHPELACRSALVSFVLLEHCRDKASFELAYGF
jgi:hypothetical protein